MGLLIAETPVLALDCCADCPRRVFRRQWLEATVLLAYLLVFMTATITPLVTHHDAVPSWLCWGHAAVPLMREVRAVELLVTGRAKLSRARGAGRRERLATASSAAGSGG